MSATPFDNDPPLTPAQRDAILRDDHTLIAAGAGSGKTTTLVDKILHSLGAERVPGAAPRRKCELREIAAITFTNAAAADLKKKLRERLRKVAAWHAERGELATAALWRERVYEVDRARIGTIHSFCGDILREFALRVGMDPSFAILDEGQTSQLREESVAEVLETAFVERPAAMELVRHLGLRKTASLVEDLASRPDVLPDVHGAWFETHGPKLDVLRTLVADQRREWECAEGVGDWNPELDELSARSCHELVNLALAARDEMVRRLDEQSAVDFDELILRTRAVLRDDPSVLAAVRTKLAWLFIDEFQDTDRAQLDIAYAISGFGERVAGAPSLCIVGDPKQSIYRFRRADVSLWASTEADFRGQGIEAIRLDTNFRSVAPIVAFVNATFDGLIGSSHQAVIDCGHDIPYAPLLEHRQAADGAAGVELLAIPASDAKAEERRAVESEHVAARTWELVEREGRSWRDIAILVRARTALPALEAALRKHVVPYYLASGDGFFGRREVMDVRLLLGALADSRDDVAWLGLFRSPWIGLTDEAILRARIAAPHAPLSAVLDGRCSEVDRPIFERARALMRNLAALRDRVPVAELIDYALSQSGYGAAVLAQPQGELAAMNLRKLVQMADGRKSDSVAEFLEFLEERESASRESDAVLFTAGENVVTISTVHAAKGLEWPIVFLVDLDRPIAGQAGRDDLHVDVDAGIGLKFDKERKSGAWEYLAQREKLLSIAEEKRLWYVAATRARDRLILCGAREAVRGGEGEEAAPASEKVVSDWLFRAIREEQGGLGYSAGGATHRVDVAEPVLRAPVSTEPAPLPTVEELLAMEPATDEATRIATLRLERSLPRYSATQLMTLARGPKEYRERYRSGHSSSVPARILGDVLHGALEVEREDQDLRSYIEVELTSALGEERVAPRIQAATERLLRLIAECRGHPSVARLHEAELCERELAFTWFARDGATTSVVNGAMDLVAIVDGAAEILDFKSHKLKAGEEQATAEEYRVQVQVYGAAMAAVSRAEVGSFTFFFPETSTPVVVPLGAGRVGEGEATVRGLFATAAASMSRRDALH